MFDKEQFRKDLLDAVEPGTAPATPTIPHISAPLIVFALIFIMLLGWVTADIWAAVHSID